MLVAFLINTYYINEQFNIVIIQYDNNYVLE